MVARIKTKENLPPPTRTVLGENVAVELHKLLGVPMLFYGANQDEKCFLLRDDNGTDYFFKVITEGRRKILDIAREEPPEKLPRGVREDDLGPVQIVEYDKWDDETATGLYGDAIWIKGYRLLDMRAGVSREWLRVGLFNYKRKPQIVFRYRGHDDFVDDDDNEA